MPPVHDSRYSSTRWAEARAAEAEAAAAIARWEYFKPLILLGIGLVAWLGFPIIRLLASGDAGSAVMLMAIGGVLLVIAVVTGVVALVIAGALLGIEGGPIPLVLLRLAGIYSITFAAIGMLGSTFCLGLLATILIMAGLIAMLFEMDIREGAIVTIIAWGIWIGTWLLLANLMG